MTAIITDTLKRTKRIHRHVKKVENIGSKIILIFDDYTQIAYTSDYTTVFLKVW